MPRESTTRAKRIVKTIAFLAAFWLALWLEISILLSSLRFSLQVIDHFLLLEAMHVLCLGSCMVIGRFSPNRINQARLIAITALGGPFVAWVAARGWAPSYVGINRGSWWWEFLVMALHCCVAAAFLLVALRMPSRERSVKAEPSSMP